MINTSNEYKESILRNRTFDVNIRITFRDGSVCILDKKDIKAEGIRIEDAVSNQGSFDIGSAIINQCTIVLNNMDEKYSQYDFDGAILDVGIGLVLSQGTEFLKKGKYILEPGKYTGVTITLKGLDYMSKFDREYSESTLEYPATMRRIIMDACEVCGVYPGMATFENDDYIVQKRPDDKALTFRQVLFWCGQIACKWWKCNANGELVCGWYDSAVFEEAEQRGSLELQRYHDIQLISSQNISTEDVVITGVKVTEYNEGEETNYISGAKGYVLGIVGNSFIQEGDGENVASYLGMKLIGMKFRPLTISCLSDPSMEAGDCVYVTDRKRNKYQCFITNTTFTIGGNQEVSCDAATPGRNSATRYSPATQAYVAARKLVREEKTQRELAIEKLANTIAESSGLYVTTEKQPDGSNIYLAHNKPTKEESDIIWKFAAEAIGISIDGGKTWPYGFTVTGEMIMKVIQTEGINADWINAGELTIRDEEGNITFSANTETGKVSIIAESFEVKGKSVEEIVDENVKAKKMYRLYIISTNGNTFKNGNIDTILQAVVYSWDEEVTSRLDDNQFIWSRQSGNTEDDKRWNAAHAGGTKQIQITGEDVRVRATFFCDLIDTTTRQSLLEKGE